jgi:nitrite reductase/ring-hydroxylating ferredoxin subunit
MSDDIGRREFLSRMWQVGGALIGAAGVWTTWEMLRVRETQGVGGVIPTVAESTVATEPVEVKIARSYLTRDPAGEVVALSEVCPHLGCRVPWCESSGQFECPCHGSVFNRLGEYRSGPSPRGMDRHPVTISADGVVEIDTDVTDPGGAPGDESIDEPPRGPSCTEGGGH